MKEKPHLPDTRLIDRIGEAYGVPVSRVEFLPIGDISSAKYRVVTNEPAAYFLKLRKGKIKEISLRVPECLHQQGIDQVLSPLKTREGRLWTNLEAYTCILYPFIKGRNGFQKPLTDHQWIGLGAALQRAHSVNLPPDLLRQVPSDTCSPCWRESVRRFLAQAESIPYEEPVAVKMAAGLRMHRDEIRYVIERADALGKALLSQPAQQVLCHTDIHAGNLLLEENGAWHMIDWDDPMMAPKERDLMFIGGGIGGIWNTAREEALFFQGYRGEDIDRTALTYYRYERIVSDIAEFCQQILSTTEGGADRERSLQKFNSIFLPNQVLEIAYQTDLALKASQNITRPG